MLIATSGCLRGNGLVSAPRFPLPDMQVCTRISAVAWPLIYFVGVDCISGDGIMYRCYVFLLLCVGFLMNPVSGGQRH